MVCPWRRGLSQRPGLSGRPDALADPEAQPTSVLRFDAGGRNWDGGRRVFRPGWPQSVPADEPATRQASRSSFPMGSAAAWPHLPTRSKVQFAADGRVHRSWTDSVSAQAR